MKAANRRLIVSIAALVVAIALTTTATFAWFSVSANPSLTGLNMKVATQSNLLISLTGEDGTYFSNININDLPDAAKIRFQGVKLTPLTPKLDATDLPTQVMLDSLGETVVKTDISYFEFDLFFRASSALWVRPLASGTTFDSANVGTNFRAWREFLADELYPGSPHILPGENMISRTGTTALVANAARIGFTEATVTKTKTVGGTGDTVVSSVAVADPAPTTNQAVFRPNANQGYSAPKYNHLDAPSAGFHAAHDHYFEVNGVYPTITDESPDVINFEDYNNTYTVATGGYAGESLIQLSNSTGIIINGLAQYEGCLRVKIWVEGTDPDAFEEILDQLLNVVLRFQGLTQAQIDEEITNAIAKP